MTNGMISILSLHLRGFVSKFPRDMNRAMGPDDWARVKSLFEAASAIPAADREHYLAGATRDTVLRREVEQLLAADLESTDGWADRLAKTIADHVSLRTVGPGQAIGPYRIDEQIGRGGMGVVYRAFDTRLQRPVALKLVDDVTLDATARSSLLREAQCASALNHPHVCTVFDFGEFQGDPYIVMELIDGRPLNGMTRGAGLTPDDALRYGVQIAEALGHAHTCGVVHGDLKTANILITRDQRAKLLDFGVARRLGGDAEAAAQGSSPHGTPVYMAPEVVSGATASERSDVWSCGVVLHELLAGSLPFSGATRAALTTAILDDAPAPLPASVPEGIRLVVAHCLSKQPMDRYRDGSELARALSAARAADGDHKTDDRSVVTAAVSGRHTAVAPAAYALYQRGQGLYWRGTRRDLDAAVQMFDRATTLDPGFAPAHAALAHTCGRIHRYYDRDERWLHRGMAAAQRALALQPQLAEAFAAIALLHYAHEEYEEVIRYAHMALEQKEDCDGAYAILGQALHLLDRPEEAAALADRAIEISGHDYYVYLPYGTVLERLGHLEKANIVNSKLRRVLEWQLGWAPDNARARIVLASTYAKGGRREDALRETEIAVAFDPDDPSNLLNAGCVYSNLGMKAEAIAMVRRAIQNGYWHVDVLQRDPDFDNIRDEPEFQRLLIREESQS
jgi:Tfp pilus assembly protein PilF/predicted Ser/Thr protein kinase